MPKPHPGGAAAESDDQNETTVDEDLNAFPDDEDDSPRFERFKDPRMVLKAARKRAAAAEALTEDGDGLMAKFVTTYQPSRHEAGWLKSSLKPFYEQDLISDVLFSVKGGKEASVYCVQAAEKLAESLGVERLAAKVYRPREFRQLRNDAMYRQGRAILTEEGRAVRPTDHRILRAVGKKTDFGASVQHSSWLLYEYTTLQTLHRCGAAVPLPVAVGENAILMSYVGEESRGAPTLIEVGMGPGEAHRVFDLVKRTLKILGQEGVVHGDLSPYNILYHDGDITFIDFPQVVRFGENEHAGEILYRDLTRLVDYFNRMGVSCNVERLWKEVAPAGATV